MTPCPVIDAHHHIWRQADLPWLSGPMLPRIFGPYEPIRRDYPIEEYLADIVGTGVVKSVYVQANWAPERAEDEVAWVQRDGRRDRLAARHRRLCRPDGGGRAAGARPAGEISADARHPHAAPLARRTRNTASPSARTSPTTRRSAGTSRRSPTTASPSTCRSSPARWRARRGSRRISRRPPSSCSMPACWRTCPKRGGRRGATGMQELAAQPNVVVKALRPRHLHPSQRSGAHRLDRAGDGGALRRRPLPLRLELPDREAVDGLSAADRRLSRGARGLSGATSAPCSTTRARIAGN